MGDIGIVMVIRAQRGKSGMSGALGVGGGGMELAEVLVVRVGLVTVGSRNEKKLCDSECLCCPASAGSADIM